MLVAALARLVVGLGFSGSWQSFIRFVWAQPFGQTDPVYHRDIGFYLFRLPFLNEIQNAAAILAFLATAAVRLGLCPGRPPSLSLGARARGPTGVLSHLLANALLFLLAWAAGYVLDRYGLLTESSGVPCSAPATPRLHVTRWALWGGGRC